MTTAQVLPKELEPFIQGKEDVLREELVIDGCTITVAQAAKNYRVFKAVARLNMVLAILALLMLGGMSYWYNAHPVEKIVVIPTSIR